MKPIRCTLAGIACASALLSCDDATSNSNVVSDFFVLQSVADDPLPAVIVVGDYTSWEIVADTLRFRNDGTGTEVVVRRPTYPDVGPGPNQREEHAFQYTLDRGVLDIVFTCPDFAAGNTTSCLAPPHYRGYLTMDGILFELALYYPTPFRFTRKAIQP